MVHTAPVHGEHHDSFDEIKINTISTNHPNQWLAAGLSDYKRCFLSSTVYGVAFAAFFYVILGMFSSDSFFILAMSSGFLLLGPFLAVGLYDLSLRMERGEPATFMHSATAWKRNLVSISSLAILLGVIMVAWVRLAALIVGLFFSNSTTIGAEGMISGILASDNAFNFILAYAGSGLLLAAAVFAVSAVSFPMMLDRDVDFVTAAVTSVRAVMKNKVAMIYWAAVIVATTVIGFATYGVGLIFLVPVLGHATWYAYKDLVDHTEV